MGLSGEFTGVKPSGLPLGQISQEDTMYAAEGEEYIIEENNHISVQYIRIHILETWDNGTTVAQFAELEFYGDIDK